MNTKESFGDAMTLEQKREFTNELLNSVKSDLMMKVTRVPDDWDGHELRVWISAYFTSAAEMSCINRDKRSSRRRQYENAVIVNNL